MDPVKDIGGRFAGIGNRDAATADAVNRSQKRMGVSVVMKYDGPAETVGWEVAVGHDIANWINENRMQLRVGNSAPGP